MHKVTRKLAALLAVLVLAVGVFFTASPAMAAGTTGTITVTSNSKEFEGKTVSAYQVFKVDNGSYVLNETFKKFFVQECDLTDDATLSSKAFDYVNALGADDDKDVINFAKEMRAWVLAQTPAIPATGTGNAVASSGKYVAQVTVGSGYYLVVPALGSTGNNNRGTDAMLTNVVVDETASIELKSQYPTVDKTVQNGEETAGDKTSAEIGDTLTFTLTSQVPDVTNYDYYQFAFSDNLSNGLTLNRDSIKVWIDDNLLIDDTDYRVNGSGGQLTINLGVYNSKAQIGDDLQSIYDAKKLFENKAGQTITAQYTATLNANAVVGNDNPNSAKVEYSNDPDSFGTGSSTTTVTHQYDFEFILKKVDEDKAPLANAVFELQDAHGNAIDLVQVTADNGTDGAVYRKAMETGDTGSVVDPKGRVTTGTSGIIKFQGLAAGTYKLVEVDAPEGYNGLDGAVEITIADTTTDPETSITWTVSTKDGGPAANHTVTIENHKGIELPSTGGMGTVIFTVVGVAVVAGGAIWMVQRNRRNAASNGSHMA